MKRNAMFAPVFQDEMPLSPTCDQVTKAALPDGRAAQAVPRQVSAEAPGDVVLGALVARVGEDLLGLVVLDQDPRAGVGGLVHFGGEERRPVADAGGLLHVVG